MDFHLLKNRGISYNTKQNPSCVQKVSLTEHDTKIDVSKKKALQEHQNELRDYGAFFTAISWQHRFY